MRRWPFLAAGLLALLPLALWLLPPWLDAGRYRARMEAYAAAALGQNVRIGGPVSFRLLPEPMLSAADVSLGAAADGPALSVPSLRLALAWKPLLRGHVDVRELVLRGPHLRLAWPQEADAPLWRGLPAMSDFALRIERGRLSLGALVLEDIDATISAQDAGPLAHGAPISLAGSARLMGQDWRLAGRLGVPAADGAAQLDVGFEARGGLAGTGLELSGRLLPGRGLLGRVTLRAANLAALAPAPPLALRAEGPLRLGPDGLEITDMALDLAGIAGRASVLRRWSDPAGPELTLSLPRLDLDPWLAPWLATLPRTLGALPPLRLGLNLEAATLAGGTLRKLHLRLAWSGERLIIAEAGALLPGEASLHLSGQAGGADGAAFGGTFRLAAPRLRATLAWLDRVAGHVLPALADGVLTSAELDGQIEIGATGFTLAGLRGSVDGAGLSGGVAYQRDAHPAMAATLIADHIRLDPWLPTSVGDVPAWWNTLRAQSIGLRVSAGEAQIFGHNIRAFELDGEISGNRVQLRRLAGARDGLTATLSGRIEQDGAVVDGRGSLSGDEAAALARLLPASLRLTPAFWQGRLALRLEAAGPAEALALRLAGEIGDLRLEVQPVWDRTLGRLTGRVMLRHPSARRFFTELGLRTPSEETNVPYPAWFGEGSLALQAQGLLGPERLHLDGFDLTAGLLRGSGQLGLDWSGPRRVLAGRFLAETLPLPWPAAPGESVLRPGLFAGWEGVAQIQAAQVLADATPVATELACTLTLEGERLRLDPCGARIAEGSARIEASVDALDPPRIVLKAHLDGARPEPADPDGAPETGLALAGGEVDARLAVETQGHTRAGLIAAARGTLRLEGRDGVLRGIGLSAAAAALDGAAEAGAADFAARLRAALEAGETSYNQLRAELAIADGLLRVETATLTGPWGEARLSGEATLADHAVDVRLTARPNRADAPTLGLRLTGPAAAPARVPDLAAALRWLADLPR